MLKILAILDKNKFFLIPLTCHLPILKISTHDVLMIRQAIKKSQAGMPGVVWDQIFNLDKNKELQGHNT